MCTAIKTWCSQNTHTHLLKGLGKEGGLGRTLREGNGECLSPSRGLQVGTSISWGEDGGQLVWTGATKMCEKDKRLGRWVLRRHREPV